MKQFLSRMPSGFIGSLRWQYLANLGAGLIGGLYYLCLGNWLGVANFGRLSLSLAITTVIFNISELRLQEAVIRFAPMQIDADVRYKSSLVQSFFLLDGLVRGVITLIIVALSAWLNLTFLHQSDGIRLILLSVTSLFCAKACNAPAVGLLRLTGRFSIHAKVLVADWSLKLALTAIIFFLWGLTIERALTILSVVSGCTNIFIILVSLQGYTFQSSIRSRGKWLAFWYDVRHTFHFILPSYGISFFDNAVREIDTTIVGWFLNVEAVGVYRMTKNFVQLIWRAADPVFLVVMPIFSRFYQQDDHAGLIAFLRRLTILLTLVSIALVFSSIILLPVVMRLFLHPEFAFVSRLLPWMIWWILVSLPLIWTHALAAAAGRPGLQLHGNIWGNLLAIFLLFLLTPTWGLAGAAMAWSTGLAATFLIAYLAIRRAGLFNSQTIHRRI